jgi:hypothetical protein
MVVSGQEQWQTILTFFVFNTTQGEHIDIYAPLLRDEVSESISDDIMPLNNWQLDRGCVERAGCQPEQLDVHFIAQGQG